MAEYIGNFTEIYVYFLLTTTDKLLGWYDKNNPILNLMPSCNLLQSLMFDYFCFAVRCICCTIT